MFRSVKDDTQGQNTSNMCKTWIIIKLNTAHIILI
jgi:hypothetical protein